MKLKSHGYGTAAFYFIFGTTAFSLILWLFSLSPLKLFDVSLTHLIFTSVIGLLLGPIPIVVGALGLLKYFVLGRPQLILNSQLEINKPIVGQLGFNQKVFQPKIGSAKIACYKVKKLYLPLSVWAGGLTAIYGDKLIWSTAINIDSNFKFQTIIPRNLPGSDSPFDNPAYGHFWRLEINMKAWIPFRLYFTLPISL